MIGVKFIQKGERSVFDAFQALNSLSRNTIVRPNNPPPGISGFIFDVIGDEELDMDSDITDHWSEANTALQDQIALKPIEVKVKGTVAELYSVVTPFDLQALVADPLPLVPEMLPELTPGAEAAEIATDEAEAAETNAITSAGSLFTYYSNRVPTENITRQAKALTYFKSLRDARQLCTVETPWGIWLNMAILKISVRQPDNTRDISEFSVTFKQMKFAQDVTVSIGQLAGRAVAQRSGMSQNGTLGKEAKPRSLLDRLANS